MHSAYTAVAVGAALINPRPGAVPVPLASYGKVHHKFRLTGENRHIGGALFCVFGLRLASCVSFREKVELEFELIQSHMAQKPVLRGEVGCACVAREVSKTLPT